MPINYIPNDPLAVADVPLRPDHRPRPDRPSARAGFEYEDLAAPKRWPVGSPEFLFWQCSEAALAALEAWEKLDGPLSRWARNRKRLKLRQDRGVDLNAYYDRSSLSFFHWTTGGKTTWSGASTDVVAHEAGHALLDAIRPDLWGSFYTEVNAFHEAFADCIALLTALDDRESRRRLIRVAPDLWAENFLEATAEDLADGIRREEGASHPAAKPRHAFNWFNWQLPSTLPTRGGPSTLTSEIHSFGRVFSGCFYDLVGILWNSQPSWSDQALWQAAETAGKLLIEGARSAPETPRFFQSVGRAMILADDRQNGGANRKAVHDAFAYHNVALGSSAMLAPTAALAGPSLAQAAAPALSAPTRRDVLSRLDAPKAARLSVKQVELAGKRVLKAVHDRAVALGKVDRRLAGVVALAAEPVLIGRSGKQAAVLGRLPEVNVTVDEVHAFVETLLDHDCVDWGARRAKTAVASTGHGAPARPTHAVRKLGQKRVLKRVRYVCRPGSVLAERA